MNTEAAPATLVRDVKLFDGQTVVPVVSVLIEQGLVACVQPRIDPPPGAEVIDGRGRTLLPGLLDSCVHVAPNMLYDALRYGVTTEIDLFADRAATPAPRLGVGAPLRATRFLDDPVRDTADYVRPPHLGYAGEDGDERLTRLLVATGHGRRQVLITRVTDRDSARRAVLAGVDGLVGTFGDAPAGEPFIQAVADARAFVLPALAGATGAPEFGRDAVRRLHEAGVPIVVGSDAPISGLAHGTGPHDELAALVAAGLRPVDALAAATSVPAHRFGLTDRGRIERGRQADVVLVDGDPTENITATRAIVRVWRRGVPVRRVGETDPHRVAASAVTYR